MKFILTVFVVGITSTIVMDIAGGLMRMIRMSAGAPPALIGKWLESAIRGNVFVGDIRNSDGTPVTLSRFLLYHYIIGVLLTLMFFVIIAVFKISPIPWWMPLSYGFATIIIPIFLMFPGMGFGIFGLNGPQEYLLLRTAILNHLFFGIGLTLSFRLFFHG